MRTFSGGAAAALVLSMAAACSAVPEDSPAPDIQEIYASEIPVEDALDVHDDASDLEEDARLFPPAVCTAGASWEPGIRVFEEITATIMGPADSELRSAGAPQVPAGASFVDVDRASNAKRTRTRSAGTTSMTGSPSASAATRGPRSART